MKFSIFWMKQTLKKIIQMRILPNYYRFICKNTTVDNKLVIFADAHNKSIPYSMELLHKKFLDEGYRIEDIFCDYGHSDFFTIFKSMFKFMKCYASAKYVIVCDYFLPVSSADKRKETIVIQLWHACGVFKKFGYDAEDDIPKDYKGLPSKNFDLVTVSSSLCEKVYSNAFKIPTTSVKSLGVSRTDRFFDTNYIYQCTKDFFAEYPEAKGKKIILWAPTFRGNAGKPILVGKQGIETLKSQLGNDYFIITKLHPHFKNVTDITCNIPTERLLPVADLLISDYSTVIFEYSLFNKPLVLFVPDFNEYYTKRGFYLNYNELPGLIVKNETELTQAVLSAFNNSQLEKNKSFLNKYMSACDGNSTNRIFNEIIRLGLGGDLNK